MNDILIVQRKASLPIKWNKNIFFVHFIMKDDILYFMTIMKEVFVSKYLSLLKLVFESTTWSAGLTADGQFILRREFHCQSQCLDVWLNTVLLVRLLCSINKMSSLRRGRTKSPLLNCITVCFTLFIVLFLVSNVTCARPQYTQNQIIRTRYSNDRPNQQQSVMPLENTQIRYSTANVSNDYKSSTKFHHKGMGHLYFITNQFVNVILKGQIYPEGMLALLITLYLFSSLNGMFDNNSLFMNI